MESAPGASPSGLSHGAPALVDPALIDALTAPAARGGSEDAFRTAAAAMCPPLRSLRDAAPAFGHLSVGCKVLDAALAGGIPVGQAGLVEFAGPAGAGKTQLALQLALCTAADVSPVVYAVTAGRFPSGRAREIESAISAAKQLPDNRLLDKILVETIQSVDHLIEWTQWRLPYLLRQTGARLVIIDSIAALYRPEFDDPLARANHLTHTAAALKTTLREVHGVGICLNHVSQRFERSNQNGTLVVPALGQSWSACLTMRVYFDKKLYSSTGRATHSLRPFHGSHVTPETEAVQFLIDKAGVRAVS